MLNNKLIFLFIIFLLLLKTISSLEKLKIMTYNIHFGNSIDNIYNIKEIGRIIKDSRAEVVCLQEVDVNWGSRSLYENTIQRLSYITGLNYFYAPIYNKPSHRSAEYPNEQFGVGILSKYEILHQSNYNLSRWSTQSEDPQPGDPDFPPKKGGFGNIIISVNGKKISIYNTHLDFRETPPPEYFRSIREIQVNEMIEIIDFENYPTILMGDMNADTTSKEVFSPLFNYFNDAWELGNITSGYSFPSDNPVRRIDYILTTRDIFIKKSYLLNTTASDHLPVIADISF